MVMVGTWDFWSGASISNNGASVTMVCAEARIGSRGMYG
jgi:hypothetical protein